MTSALDPTVLATCLPPLDGLNWAALAEMAPVFVGAGAVNGPLAEHLAYLGMKRCVVVDPKLYKPQSRVSQCDPQDVGRPKAVVLAERLRALGAEATALVTDVCDLEPGWVGRGGLVIASVDNRRADILANRLAATMRGRFVKVNVEPLWLHASVRCFDFRGPRPDVCAECGMTAAQYAGQRHPAGCEGDGVRPTGSPRALSQLAAGAGALAVAQLVGSPDRWARQWYGRQWDLSLLGGQATWSILSPNPGCRWDHGRHWRNLTWLETGPKTTTLAGLLATADVRHGEARVRFSGRVVTQACCDRCGRGQDIHRWLPRPDAPVGVCACGGTLVAVPFFTATELSVSQLLQLANRPLADWGVPPRAVIAIDAGDGREQSFVIGSDPSGVTP
jgi:hypothetical protein